MYTAHFIAAGALYSQQEDTHPTLSYEVIKEIKSNKKILNSPVELVDLYKTIMDLTGVAKYIISTTFKPIEVFIVAGGIYLFMTFIIHNIIKYLEKKYSFQQ